MPHLPGTMAPGTLHPLLPTLPVCASGDVGDTKHVCTTLCLTSISTSWPPQPTSSWAWWFTLGPTLPPHPIPRAQPIARPLLRFPPLVQLPPLQREQAVEQQSELLRRISALSTQLVEVTAALQANQQQVREVMEKEKAGEGTGGWHLLDDVTRRVLMECKAYVGGGRGMGKARL